MTTNSATQKKTYNVGTAQVQTAAQGMTVIAYGDSRNGEKAGIPVRSLDFNCKCEDLNDLKQCIQIIHSYNEFAARKVNAGLDKFCKMGVFYNDRNPNNGSNPLRFHIARESSPAFYVSYGYYPIKRTVNGEIQDYPEEQWAKEMETMSELIGADEFSIEGKQARFWFD